MGAGAAIELRSPVSCSEEARRALPLFCEEITRDDTQVSGYKARPFSASSLDTLLSNLLRKVVPKKEAELYSWHSFRIALACALMHSGVPPEEIQRICRWESLQSLRIYGRFEGSAYIERLSRIKGVNLSRVQMADLEGQLPRIDPDGDYAQLPGEEEAMLMQELHID